MDLTNFVERVVAGRRLLLGRWRVVRASPGPGRSQGLIIRGLHGRVLHYIGLERLGTEVIHMEVIVRVIIRAW